MRQNDRPCKRSTKRSNARSVLNCSNTVEIIHFSDPATDRSQRFSKNAQLTRSVILKGLGISQPAFGSETSIRTLLADYRHGWFCIACPVGNMDGHALLAAFIKHLKKLIIYLFNSFPDLNRSSGIKKTVSCSFYIFLQ